MKRVTPILISLIILTNYCIAQSGNLVKKHFITGADMTVRLYDYFADSAMADLNKYKLIFPANWKFKVVSVSQKNNLIIIRQWSGPRGVRSGIRGGSRYKEDLTTLDFPRRSNNKDSGNNRATVKHYAYTSNLNDNQYFSVPLSEFESKCDPYYPRGWDLTFGVMTIPIKLRTSSKSSGSYFEYDEKFNIGLSAGAQYSFQSRKERSISFLLNASISTVRIDSLNTKGYQKENSTSGAFTMATGLVFRQNDFNIGVFLGWDKVPGVLGSKWVFNNKPWIGLGIGFSIFSAGIGGEKTGVNNTGGGSGKSKTETAGED